MKGLKRSLRSSNEASAIPLILFFVTIFSVGALYTLFFLEIGLPELTYLVPASDSKTFIIMLMYALPLFIIVVGLISVLKEALKPKYGAYP